MTVRTATRGDLPAVQRVAERAWDADYPGVLNRENLGDAAREWYDADAMAAELDRGDSVVLVAEAAGDEGASDMPSLAGFVHALVDDETGHVLRLYVDPDSRREGVGTALFDAAVDALFDRGVDVVAAMVLEENEPGRKFYRNLGLLEREDRHETVIGGERYTECVYESSRTARQSGDGVD